MKYLDGFLLASLVLVVGFHAHLFHVLNAGPVLDLRAAGAPPAGFWMQVDECRTERGNVIVSGWIAAPDERTRRHATSAVFQDDATGLLHGMTTDLQRATPFFADAAVPPRQPGVVPTRFVASLNLQAALTGIPRGNVFLGYESEGRTFLVPTGCAAP